MDIGSCLCFNLRQGMFLAFTLQATIVTVNILNAYMNLSHPQLGIFFFAKGIELNGMGMISWVTGAATLVVGFAALFRKSGAGTVRLWLLLSFFLAPVQLFAGGLYSYRCLLIYQDFTPSLVAINTVITYAVQSNMPPQPAPDKEETKKEAVAAFKERFSSASDFEHSFFQKADELTKPKPPSGYFGKFFARVSNWFKRRAEGFRVWRKKRSGWLKVALGGAIVIGALVFSNLYNEAQMMYEVLPPPMNQYYRQGLYFMLTFLIRGLLYTLIFLGIAIHVSAYYAVKARGGSGEEFVGYRKIRWFYRQSAENRRKIRAGGQLREQRMQGSDPDTDDSGSEFEQFNKMDAAGMAAVSADIAVKKLQDREKRRMQI